MTDGVDSSSNAVESIRGFVSTRDDGGRNQTPTGMEAYAILFAIPATAGCKASASSTSVQHWAMAGVYLAGRLDMYPARQPGGKYCAYFFGQASSCKSKTLSNRDDVMGVVSTAFAKETVLTARLAAHVAHDQHHA